MVAVQFTSENEILIYRIVQELVSNVFNPKKLKKAERGIGLDSLEEMIHKLDGEIHIDSNDRRGTTINVDISFVVPENHTAP